MTRISLDDLYYMVAHIYSEQNARRTPSATFAHFVEVCGNLAHHAQHKKRESFTTEDALCKALGWFFPLLAKFRVRSVEELVFRKFPFACPYCRELPHKEAVCKSVKGTEKTVNHAALKEKYKEHQAKRPVTLDEWQQMFQEIYPRKVGEVGSTLGLLEEIGELAEGIRVFDKYPKYFAGEAADVFSYLMGVANEYSLQEAKHERQFSFEMEFISRYPGLCLQCGCQICICPSVPEATVGRMAKELDLTQDEAVFQIEGLTTSGRGADVGGRLLENVGGYKGVIRRFPLDRGAANSALVFLLLRLAEAVKDKPQVAERLRSAALTVGSSVSYAGSRQQSVEVKSVLEMLQTILPEVGPVGESVIGSPEEIVEKIGKIIKKLRILIVFANPKGSTPLRLQEEERVIKEAIQLSGQREQIEIRTLPAATTDDLRRELLKESYDILHFSGHGHPGVLDFEDPRQGRMPASLHAIGQLIRRYPRIQCVLLNACWSLKDMSESLTQFTVGMDLPLGDHAAIEFAKGFYDAIGAGKTIELAIEEGKCAVELKGSKAHLPLKVLKSQANM